MLNEQTEFFICHKGANVEEVVAKIQSKGLHAYNFKPSSLDNDESWGYVEVCGELWAAAKFMDQWLNSDEGLISYKAEIPPSIPPKKRKHR